MGTPDSWIDVLLLPGILVFLGAITWIGSWLGDRERPKPSPWRWIALIPLLFAFFVGCRYMWEMYNPETGAFYRESMRMGLRMSRRLLLAHFLSFILPAISLIVVFVWAKIDKQRRQSLEDY